MIFESTTPFEAPRVKEKPPAEIFKSRLASIINAELSLDNVESFEESVLSELINLTRDVLRAYSKQSQADPSKSDMVLENEAYKYYGLDNLGGVLDLAYKTLGELSEISGYIDGNMEIEPKPIMPPGEQRFRRTNNGDKLERTTHPRLMVLLRILTSDLGIQLNQINIILGEVLDGQFRNEPYHRVQIDKLNRVIYVCDEDENATYVFDTSVINIIEVDPDSKSKAELNQLITDQPGCGRKINYSNNWRQIITECLVNNFAKTTRTDGLTDPYLDERELFPCGNRGELDKWRGYFAVNKDQEGKQVGHWAPLAVLGKKFGLDPSTIEREIERNKSKHVTRPVKDPGGHIRDAYCYEKLAEIPLIKAHLEAKRVEVEGLWKGFYINETDQNHYGPLETIIRKIGVAPRPLVIKAMAGAKKIDIKDSIGVVTPGYRYEDIIAKAEINRLLELQLLTGDAEFDGFYYDPQTKEHWANISLLAGKFGLPHDWLENQVKKRDKIRIKTKNRGENSLYSYESLETNEGFRAYLANNKAWKDSGFSKTDNGDFIRNGEVFVSLKTISKVTKRGYTSVKTALGTSGFKAENVLIRGTNCSLYRVEDVRNIFDSEDYIWPAA